MVANRRISRLRVLLGAALAAAAIPRADAQVTQAGSVRLSDRRIVKVFDFLEPENHEPVPMHWEKLSEYGFPDFAQGQFDARIGHEAAPSFRLSAEGANVAYVYRWRDIPVKPGSLYEIRGLIRTRGMPNARAYISACFTDRYGRKLAGSERFSGLVGGDAGDSEWRPVVVRLAGDYPSARLIGLAVWVTQESVWSRGPVPPRRIESKDVAAVAWFDDLQVRRLPRVSIAPAGGSPLFRHNEQVQLDVSVADPDALNISAEMAVYDSDRRPLWQGSIPISTGERAAATQLTLPELPAGLYRAELQVRTNGEALSSTDFGFAVLGPQLASHRPGAGRFGVILEEVRRGQWLANQTFLRELAVSRVKVPIRGDDWTTPAATTLDESFDQLLEWLVRNRTGVVAELREPTFLASPKAGRAERALLDVLSGEPEDWLPYASYLLSRYADMVTAWQIGTDGDAAVVWDDRLFAVLSVLRPQFATFVFDPRVAGTWSIDHQLPAGAFPGDCLSIRVPPEVAPDWIGAYWSSLPPLATGQYWAYVEPLPAERYCRRARLADLAERLVQVARTDASVIFMAQPWQWDSRWDHGRPTEEFLVLRTVAALLAEARWVGRFLLDERTTAEVFDRRGAGVLVVQDKSASEGVRTVSTHLGDGARVIDLRGRLLPVGTRDGQTDLPVCAEPLFVDGVEAWLMRTRGSVRLDDGHLETASGLQTRTVEFTNHATFAIAGVLRLFAPPFWEVRPARLPFHLQPGETFRETLTVRVPNNESAGDRLVTCRMTLDAGAEASFTVPMPIKLGLRDVDVVSVALARPDGVVVRQMVTNRSSETLSFDGFVSAPGRARVSRLIRGLAPGQTVTKHYRLPEAQQLIGSSLRVGLRQIGGNRQYSEAVVVP